MKDLSIHIPASPPYTLNPLSMDTLHVTPTTHLGAGAARRLRLMKRTSVEVLPDYPTAKATDSKCFRTEDSPNQQTSPPQQVVKALVAPPHGDLSGGLRTSSSDPHLVGLLQPAGHGDVADPMISMCDRDINSPVMFMQTDSLYDNSLTMDDMVRPGSESVAMETG